MNVWSYAITAAAPASVCACVAVVVWAVAAFAGLAQRGLPVIVAVDVAAGA